MRHIRPLLAAIVIAPLAWVLLALGQARSSGAFPHSAGDTLHGGDFLRPVLLLAAAGLLLGLLATLRLSPLGAIAIGVLYTLSYTLLLVAPDRIDRLFPDDLYVAGHLVDLGAPLRSGTAMVLGVLLLVAAASAQRWRAWPRPVAGAGAGAEPATGTTLDPDRPLGTEGLDLSPSYDQPSYDEPPTRERTLTGGRDAYRW
jgi:hypothetical protein